MDYEKTWIWQEKDYPNFTYDNSVIDPLAQEINLLQGILKEKTKLLNDDVLLEKQSQILEDEVISSAVIEGEYLNRDSVRASISRKLGLQAQTNGKSNPNEDGMVDILIDANSNYDKNLDKERIFGWHNALFPTGYSGLHKIIVADYRGEEPMEVVSTKQGRDKVYYVAPPRDILEVEMKNFFSWFNNTPDTIVKSAIVHLWFLIIHPLDDGNGRISRVLSDLVLSRIEKSNISKLYSMSVFINNDKKGYYAVLEHITGYIPKQTDPMDITMWIEWYANTLLLSLQDAENKLKYIYQKVEFWDKHREDDLNARQIKVLNKILDIGVEKFGDLNRKKYKSIASASDATVTRDLNDLVEKGCIAHVGESSNKGVKYTVVIK